MFDDWLWMARSWHDHVGSQYLEKIIKWGERKEKGKESQDEGWCVVVPKRKFLSISVHIICSVRAGNELWEEEERNPSEDLTRLSDVARGLTMNNT